MVLTLLCYNVKHKLVVFQRQILLQVGSGFLGSPMTPLSVLQGHKGVSACLANLGGLVQDWSL